MNTMARRRGMTFFSHNEKHLLLPHHQHQQTRELSQEDEQLNIAYAFQKLLDAISDPVDFDLPCSLKQWKSSEDFIPIKRNIYLIKRRIEDDGIFCSCVAAPNSSMACDTDCHCGMLFSCCSSSCKCEGKCSNRPFQNRSLKKMKLFKTVHCGFGVIAGEEIKKGEFVIEYVGEVIDDRLCEERLWKMKRRGDTNFYLCEVNWEMIIDATNKGNLSRFMNHSCAPNTVMQKWRVDGETRVGIFALRDIKRGEEVTYDYMFVQFGADQVCRCGSASCRQFLGNKTGGSHLLFPYKRKAEFQNCIGELIRVWRRQYRMYVAAVIENFDLKSGLHTITYIDDSIETVVVDLSKEDWDFLPHIRR